MPTSKHKESTFSPRRLMKSFGYAFSGCWYLLRHERNFQVHFVAVIVTVAAGIFFNLSNIEWCAIVLAMMVVLLGEAMNSAIEKLCDLVQPSQDERIKTIKDVAAAGVLLAAMGAVVIAIFVFLPKIMDSF